MIRHTSKYKKPLSNRLPRDLVTGPPFSPLLYVPKTGDGQQSRLRRLNNGVPQGSVLAPLLFNIYIHDLPETTSKKYGYADDIAILATHKQWVNIEEDLSKDMDILSAYLRNWRLKLSEGKTVSTAFHLNNKEAMSQKHPKAVLARIYHTTHG